MKVSELADRAGVTAKTVRFYEAEGILPRPSRAANGYREYGEADLCRLRMVVSLRALGLGLDESGRLAGMCAAGNCEEMTEDLVGRLARRRAEIAAARHELDHLDRELGSLEAALQSGQPVGSLCLGKEEADDGVLRVLP
jgi:DNA-binding transcriptional MerR regulator